MPTAPAHRLWKSKIWKCRNSARLPKEMWKFKIGTKNLSNNRQISPTKGQIKHDPARIRAWKPQTATCVFAEVEKSHQLGPRQSPKISPNIAPATKTTLQHQQRLQKRTNPARLPATLFSATLTLSYSTLSYCYFHRLLLSATLCSQLLYCQLRVLYCVGEQKFVHRKFSN